MVIWYVKLELTCGPEDIETKGLVKTVAANNFFLKDIQTATFLVVRDTINNLLKTITIFEHDKYIICYHEARAVPKCYLTPYTLRLINMQTLLTALYAFLMALKAVFI